ncbi:serine/threonine-protein kinase Nek8 [Anopheles maculipalpis]|uniref:serine/threonine-protein kinase Nek8 n=1 Tax=Anopheles maculipalpis TaxID=1496333 RepID=UPI002158C5FB|nr:serine/threonine-protein kinase Nek8 [Anopheles maculipalpis]
MELKEIHRTCSRKPNTDQSIASYDLSVLSRFQNLSLFVGNPAQNITSDVPNASSSHTTQHQHALDLTGYRKIRSVGQGSFGTAILYERQSDGQQVVMKQIALSNLAKPEREMAMNEVEVFSKLHHPNIIAYLGSSVRGDLLLIEMEYADGGTLAQMLAERNQSEPLPERFVLNMFEQLTSAISYMHSQNILHRDLKTANVFLHGKGTVKVGDFGISKIMNTNVHAQTVLGTPYYFSPEMCEGKEYNEKSDVWALGCIVGEMCCLKKAFTATNLSELVGKIMTAEYVPLPTNYSESLRHVLGLMFQIDPIARPSASELLQYWIPFIYRNLGSSEGLQAESFTLNTNNSEHLKTKQENRQSTVESNPSSSVNEDASTALIEADLNHNAPSERTVLYQLHSFGASSSLAPLHLPPTIRIKQIVTRGQHFVAVMEDGSVYSWGEGDKGQLGHDALETWHHIPMRIHAIKHRKIVSAAVGEGYTIFCTASGTLLACGDNSNGCLGQGNKAPLLVPTQINKLEHIPIVQVASGTTHVLALTEGGIVYSWGTSGNGALALGKRIHVALEPERVILPQLVQNVREVYAGPDCTILITRQGDCYCCGSNAGNRLGLGRKVTSTATLRKIQLDANRPKIVSVSVAETHAAFLIEGGFLVTLGDNTNGQRGVGHKCELPQPSIVRQLQTRYVLNVKCSQTYTVATTDDNCVLLWGTRLGTPDSNEESSGSRGRNTNEQRPSLATVANSTTALANILTSLYKHETILNPADVLALYSSKQQQSVGSYVKLLDVHPLQHSILVLVETNCPLV